MRTPPGYKQSPASGKAFLTDLREGLQTIVGHSGIRGLLTLMLLGDALGGAVRQTLPAFADNALHAGVEGFSTLLACAGVGATLSALWLAHGGGRRVRTGVIASAFLGYLIATTALLSAAALPLAAIAMVVRGFCFQICRTGTVTLLQTSVPDGLRGRVMSAQFLLQQGANSLGVAVVGVLADSFGLRVPLLCVCALAFLVWAAILRERARIEASFADVPL
jgi:MFS family permease